MDSGPEEPLLMEAVVERENMMRAYKQVMSNNGAAAVDEMPVSELANCVNTGHASNPTSTVSV